MAEPLEFTGLAEQRVFRNFNGGVNTAMAPDNLPPNVSPWGRNAVLSMVSGDQAVPACRPGFRVVNQTAIPGDPRVLKVVGFNYIDSTTGDITHYLLAATGASGVSRIDQVNPANGVLTSVGTSVFTAEETIPDATVAQNCVFFCNGTSADRKKVVLVSSALTIQPWGIETPVVTSLSVAAGGAGAMDGDYEIAISYRNADSGAVSNRSTAVAVSPSAGESIVVDWTGMSIESQVTHVKVHIRKTNLTSVFFEADDVAVATGSVSLDLTDAEMNQLIILSPSETEYSRPLAGIRGSAWHVSRMFVFDETNLYWSQLGAPEQFNPVDSLPINPKDGGKVITILPVNDTLLLILKSNGVWGLFGTAPEDWELRVLHPGIGCSAQHSAQVNDGKVVWWSEDGPMLWTQEGAPIPIGRDLLGDATSDTIIDPQLLSQMCSVVDVKRHRVLWSATRLGETQNAIIFPFNTRLGVWESHAWEAFEISAMGIGVDSTGVTWIYVGSPYGRVFEYGSAARDGARLMTDLEAPLTLKGSPTSSTVNSLTDSTATFDTEGSGLVGLNVLVVDPLTRDSMTRRIISNTSTTISVTPNWDWSLPSGTLYYLGTPVFEWDTRWEDWDQPFVKKRFTRLYAQVALSSPTGTDIDYEIYTRLDPTRAAKVITLSGTGEAGYWDLSLWDVAYFGQATVEDFRAWIGRTGRSIRVRVRCFESAVGITLLKVGLEGIRMSGRR